MKERILRAISHFEKVNGKKPSSIRISLNEWLLLRFEINLYLEKSYLPLGNIRVEFSERINDGSTILFD